MLEKLRRIGRRLAQTARLMVGVHDYETYVRHVRERHPDAPAMTREEFIRACQTARYAGGRGASHPAKCPC